MLIEGYYRLLEDLITYTFRYDKERDIPAVCRTSDINEELGLVTHLFADKTGNTFYTRLLSNDLQFNA